MKPETLQTPEEHERILSQSIGSNPEHFRRRAKLMALVRLVPF